MNVFLATISPTKTFPFLFELTFLTQLEELALSSLTHAANVTFSQTSIDFNKKCALFIKNVTDIASIWFTDATLFENLYGLHRFQQQSGNANDHGDTNSNETELFNPLSLKAKLFFCLNQVVMSLSSLTISTSFPPYLRRIKSSLASLLGVIILLQRFLYLYNISPYFDPVTGYVMNMVLVRKNQNQTAANINKNSDDMTNKRMNSNNSHRSDTYNLLINRNDNMSSASLFHLFENMNVKILIVFSMAISFKLLEWLRNHQNANNSNNNDDDNNNNLELFQSRQNGAALLPLLAQKSINIPHPIMAATISNDRDYSNSIRYSRISNSHILTSSNDDNNPDHHVNSSSSPSYHVSSSTVASSSLCGICDQPRVNTCASTGGYLFCYMCLLNHLRETGGDSNRSYCPIGGLPCTEDDIIKIYE